MGRETELAQLYEWLATARSGQRQIIFITGEPGIGKTTLVDAFVAQMAADLEVLVARGQCIEQYGPGEAYLPVLEAVERLCQGPHRDSLLRLLRQYAPLWLAQLPALLQSEEREALQRQLVGATRERMLREMAVFMEALTADTTLLLVLEDIHWSDLSTLDFLATLARRREPARLLVLSTYRPMEILDKGHPLAGMVQELHAHGQCHELAVEALSAGAVAGYLGERFGPEAMRQGPFQRLASALHQRTEGHPLFLVTTVDDLVRQGVVTQEESGWVVREAGQMATREIPKSMRQLMTRQMERVPLAARQILEAASVAGAKFSAATVAAAVKKEVVVIEERCERLARRQQFLRPAGMEEWPDGTMAARYGFQHAVYQELWHERVTVARQRQWHQQMGRRKEEAYGERVQEIAVELAVHFEQGGEYGRAVHYLRQAAETAMHRSAPQEAIRHVSTALAVLKRLPDTIERTQHELDLHLMLGAPLIATTGFAAPVVGDTYRRARDLCAKLGNPPQLATVLLGLWVFHLIRGELTAAHAIGEQILHLAQQRTETTLHLQAHIALGAPAMFLGALAEARTHLESGFALYDRQHHHAQVAVYGLDPGVFCCSYAAFTLLCLGYADQARARSEEALMLARSLQHPYTLAFALTWTAEVQRACGERHTAQEHAEALIALSQEQEFPYWLSFGLIIRGWTLMVQGQGAEGRTHINQGLAALRATGAVVGTRYGVARLAEADGTRGQVTEGLAKVTEMLVAADPQGERLWDADLYRLQGSLMLRSKSMTTRDKPRARPEREAEVCFHQAITIARRQQAKWFELRAVMDLARLWKRQGKKQEARQILAEIYGWFTEGFDTADLQEAKALLTELARGKNRRFL